MTLDGLESIGDIEKRTVERDEISELLAQAKRKLADSRAAGVSDETKIGLAYTVILACATMALRASGYRVKNKREYHFVSIETLRHTLRMKQSQLDYFQELRERRNRELYGGSIFVMAEDVQEAIKEASQILKLIKIWLKENHSELV